MNAGETQAGDGDGKGALKERRRRVHLIAAYLEAADDYAEGPRELREIILTRLRSLCQRWPDDYDLAERLRQDQPPSARYGG